MDERKQGRCKTQSNSYTQKSQTSETFAEAIRIPEDISMSTQEREQDDISTVKYSENNITISSRTVSKNGLYSAWVSRFQNESAPALSFSRIALIARDLAEVRHCPLQENGSRMFQVGRG